MSGFLACVEVGGSGIETTVFSPDGSFVINDGAHQPRGAELAIAVPGLIEGDRVVVASNLGWVDVDPVDKLGLTGPAAVLCNDAEAAALGEATLRDIGARELAFVGLGTGVGGAVVTGTTVVAGNLFGHGPLVGHARCRCGRRGCLETVAAGWALPTELNHAQLLAVADAVARAIRAEPVAASAALVVVGGGVARDNPVLVDLIRQAIGDRVVERSAAPTASKSAAAWGLRRLAERRTPAVKTGGLG